MDNTISEAQIQQSLENLDELCKEEYGKEYDLLTLLQDSKEDSKRERSAGRLRRLTGILVKKPFAHHRTRRDSEPTNSGALRAWDWDDDKLAGLDPNSPEGELLGNLAARLPEFVPTTSFRGRGIPDLRREAFDESGLFKVLALYVKDRHDKQPTKTFGEYYGTRVGRKFNALTAVTSALSSTGLATAVGMFVPPVGVAIPFALIALDFGLDYAFGAPNEPDQNN